jgi:hypothetical protein
MIGDRWGVSESETLRPYPCDDFTTAAGRELGRIVSVDPGN